MSTPLTVTRHARERWATRFPGRDLAASLARLERVTFARLLRWASSGGNGSRWRTDQEYYRDPVVDAIFVVATDTGRRTLVTVLPFRVPAKTRRTMSGCGRS